MKPDISSFTLLKQGAEAKIYTGDFLGRPTVVKERFSKKYRHPVLDKSLTSQRTKSEVRAIMRCRTSGILVPSVYFVDLENSCIYMEHFADSITVKDHILSVQAQKEKDHIATLHPLAAKIGTTLGAMHEKNIIHGDLTTSNMLLKRPVEELQLVIIDFGLSYIENVVEDKGVDLYVLERALLSTHPNTEELFQAILQAYEKSYSGSEEVIKKYEEVRQRGRKRTMVG